MRLISILLLLVAALGPISNAWARKCAYSDFRLPKHISPSHYDLQLEFKKSLTYRGTVTIDLNVDQQQPDGVPSNMIVLQAAPTLDIVEVRYRQLGQPGDEGQYLEILDTCRDDENELLVVRLKDNLVEGSQGQLMMKFEAGIRKDHVGVYSSAFFEHNSINVIISTQFEPIDARKAFPCFDEPSLKATFDLTLVHSAKKIALANTAIVSETADAAGQFVTTKFKTTPLMSTYLLAFAIGEFDFVEQVIADGRIRIRTYTPPGKSHQGQFALDTAVRAIALLEDYFDIPFPLEKIDMVAIPEMAEGKAAMENWGLITYGASDILFDEEESTFKSKAFTAMYVVHEMAHQWFGNLVTMKWWKDLWLNEGFAAWMQEFVTSHLYPEFDIDHYGLVEIHRATLAIDTELDTHPIVFEDVGKDVTKMFDKIVYYKSQAIIQYINDVYVGPEQFKEGVRSYLKKHMYGNTEASDFWSELRLITGLPVDEFMKSWLTQPGHPLVRAKLAKNKKLRLEQERRWPKVNSKTMKIPGDNQQTWIIPLTVLVSDGKSRQERLSFTFDQKTMEIELPSWFDPSNSDHWLVLNENSSGFYRVLYDDKLLKRLEKPCKSKQLGAFARANLIEELHSHYKSGLIDISTLQDSLKWFKNERVGMVLMNLSRAFRVVQGHVDGRLAKWQLVRLGKKLFEHIYVANGLQTSPHGESLTETFGSEQVLLSLVDINYEPLIKDALAAFDRWPGRPIKPEVEKIVIKAVSIHGTQQQKARLNSAQKG